MNGGVPKRSLFYYSDTPPYCNCLGNYDPNTNCATCSSNYDLSTNCATCLAGFDGKSNCTTCLAGRSGSGCPIMNCSVNSIADVTKMEGIGNCICNNGWKKDANGLCTLCDTSNSDGNQYGGPLCTSRYCGSHGSPSSNPTQPCTCELGWAGDRCTLCDNNHVNGNKYSGPNCTPNYCSGWNELPSNNPNGCICSKGWKPDSVGKCTLCDVGWKDDGQGGKCNICDSGYGGPNCISNYCVHGTSSSNPNQPACVCSTGWTKDSNGICSLCASGYGGPACTSNYCVHGTSSSDPTQPTCVCSTGWTKDTNGLCTICPNGYTGTNCDQCIAGRTGLGCTYTCPNGGTPDTTVITGSGKCNCPSNRTGDLCELCAPGYAGPNCSATYCSPNGVSPIVSTNPNDPFACICNTNFISDGIGGVCNLCVAGTAGPNCTSTFCGPGANPPSQPSLYSSTTSCVPKVGWARDSNNLGSYTLCAPGYAGPNCANDFCGVAGIFSPTGTSDPNASCVPCNCSSNSYCSPVSSQDPNSFIVTKPNGTCVCPNGQCLRQVLSNSGKGPSGGEYVCTQPNYCPAGSKNNYGQPCPGPPITCY